LTPQEMRSELTPFVNALPQGISKDLRPALNRPEVQTMHNLFLNMGNDPSAQQKMRNRLTKTPMSKDKMEFKQPKTIVPPPKPATKAPPPISATDPRKP